MAKRWAAAAALPQRRTSRDGLESIMVSSPETLAGGTRPRAGWESVMARVPLVDGAA